MPQPTITELIEWDVRNWSAALDFWEEHTTQNITETSALELGSRHGGLSLWMAQRGAHVISSDMKLPSQKAFDLHTAHGVSNLIRYEAIDATCIPYKNQFDVILFKSILGGIGAVGGKPLQARAINEIYRALKNGGELFFAENLIGSPLHQSLRRRFVKWGNTWRYVSVQEMIKFLSSFSSVEYQTIGFAGAFGRTESQRNMLGSLDQNILNYLVPENWRYIMVGVARK